MPEQLRPITPTHATQSSSSSSGTIKECLIRQCEGIRDALQAALDAQAGEPAKIDQLVAKLDPIAADGGGAEEAVSDQLPVG
jgi:hypothetical protein